MNEFNNMNNGNSTDLSTQNNSLVSYLDSLKDITKSTAMNLSNASEMLVGLVARSVETDKNVASISKELSALREQYDADTTAMKADLRYLKDLTPVDARQAKVIKDAIFERLNTILVYGSDDWKKYHQTFFKRIYGAVYEIAGVPTYREIPKEMFSAALTLIKGWTPKGGVDALKAECDEKAAKKAANS